MRIAIVTLDVFEKDGQGRVNFELTRYLLQAGFEVDLIADRVSESLLESGAGWIRVHPLHSRIHLLRTWHFKQLASRLVASRLADYDIILACGAVLDVPHTVNVVHFVHSTWEQSPFHPARTQPIPERWYRKLYTRLNARWERRALEQADSVIAVSNNVRDAICEFGVSPERVFVVPNGVDTDTYHPGPSNRHAFRLPIDVPLGLFAGDLQSPIKNLDTVLSAVSRVPEAHLAVAGTIDGSPYPRMAERLGIRDRIHFLGYCTAMDDLMRAVDYLVFPSHQDSFGLVLAEAMASGLPIITTRSVGASDLVTPDCGFVLDDPASVSGIADAMTTLSHTPELRSRMGRSSRSRIQQYTWIAMAQAYLTVFNRHTPFEAVL